jgi:hypothetical protein
MPGKNTPSQAKKILAEISPKEAHMLLLLRQHPFAEFTVRKKDGDTYLVNTKVSSLLDETAGLTLAINLVKQTT